MIDIGLFIPPGFHSMSLAPLTVFEVANLHLGATAYHVTPVSENGGKVVGSLGITTRTERISDFTFDTLLLGTTPGVPTIGKSLAARISKCVERSRRCGAIGSAAFILGAANQLAGRRIAVDLGNEKQLAEFKPACKTDAECAIVVDGPIWSCAGMSGGIDLALALLEDDFGREVAWNVSTIMAMRERRDIGQIISNSRGKIAELPDRVQRAMSFARENLQSEITIETLAEAARLSPRQFSRVFRSETGVPPGEAIARLRVEAARLMLIQGNMTSDAIAVEAGFGDTTKMEKALQKIGYCEMPRSAWETAILIEDVELSIEGHDLMGSEVLAEAPV